MINQHLFANYSPEQSELLNSFYLKKQEAKDALRELKIKYNALKTKVKTYEQKIILLDEEKESSLIMVISSNVQLALNKYIIIEKNIKVLETAIKQMDDEHKQLYSYKEQYPGMLTEKLKRISYPYSDCRYSITVAKDQLRIANKYLKKISDHLAFIRSLHRIPRAFRT